MSNAIDVISMVRSESRVALITQPSRFCEGMSIVIGGKTVTIERIEGGELVLSDAVAAKVGDLVIVGHSK